MKKIAPSDYKDFLQGPVTTYLKNRSEGEDSQESRYIRLSIHDHVLSEAEYVSQPILYREFLKRGQREKYFSFQQRFLDLFGHLLAEIPILRALAYCESFSPFDSSPPEWNFFRFETRRELDLLLPRALREIGWEILIFPDHHAIIETGYDLTWHVFMFEPVSQVFEQKLRGSGVPVLG